ncbi:hypothetical protein Hypma_004602 [Hypsizygus marmoreus]|uniref:Cyanovirin-N domain-containing protein n=1 Tax=Hypsizygus marmoreus TaxID=39966 RepID=A0A369JXR0_HYPMA|nr:hypothetical protein Hypma_004602 [Hypsizygus marmoreus]
MKFFTASLLSLSAVVLSVMGSTIPPATWTRIEDVSSEVNGNITALEKRGGPEYVTCYNSGTKIDRAPSVTCIDNFCASVFGTRLAPGQTVALRYYWGSFTILLSAQAINGCSWSIDKNCNRLLRKPLDECNTRGENGKQGGYVTDLCGQWRYDPGSNGSDE